MAVTTEAGKRLLDELSESPLPGARYARDVVALRVAAIEQEARSTADAEIERLRAALEEIRERQCDQTRAIVAWLSCEQAYIARKFWCPSCIARAALAPKEPTR